MATWETVLGTVAFGLGNGGPSGLIYTYIGVYIGFVLIQISMAEMASMFVSHTSLRRSSFLVRNALQLNLERN